MKRISVKLRSWDFVGFVSNRSLRHFSPHPNYDLLSMCSELLESLGLLPFCSANCLWCFCQISYYFEKISCILTKNRFFGFQKVPLVLRFSSKHLILFTNFKKHLCSAYAQLTFLLFRFFVLRPLHLQSYVWSSLHDLHASFFPCIDFCMIICHEELFVIIDICVCNSRIQLKFRTVFFFFLLEGSDSKCFSYAHSCQVFSLFDFFCSFYLINYSIRCAVKFRTVFCLHQLNLIWKVRCTI